MVIDLISLLGTLIMDSCVKHLDGVLARERTMRIRGGLHTTIITLCITFAIGVPQVWAKPADNYLGVGVRGGLNDDAVGVINAKFKIIDLGGVSLSGRPAVFWGDYTELRLALTSEKEIVPGWSPFLGGGLATNTNRSGEVNFMLTTGLDFQINERLVLQGSGNYIFKSNDTDAELTITLNYLF
jgi:hypothetical protein